MRASIQVTVNGQVSPNSLVRLFRPTQGERTDCEVLGRRNCQFALVLETVYIGQITLLKVGVRVGRYDIRFWRRRRWGFGAK